MLQGPASAPGRCAERPAERLTLILSRPSAHQTAVGWVTDEEMVQGRPLPGVRSQRGPGSAESKAGGRGEEAQGRAGHPGLVCWLMYKRQAGLCEARDLGLEREGRGRENPPHRAPRSSPGWPLQLPLLPCPRASCSGLGWTRGATGAPLLWARGRGK